jgi:hypothetical protein
MRPSAKSAGRQPGKISESFVFFDLVCGARIASLRGRRILMPRFINAILLGGLLLAPVVPTALQAKDNPRYHDAAHNDDHEWNSHEDKAYRVWAKENHRKYRDFAKLKVEDQQAYWGWRHEHSDALLKIDIH